MKVKVNKNQFFEDLEDLAYSSGMNIGGTWSTMRGNFEEVDITMEELEDFIDKGYGIRINC
jgi:hypothetical protein